MILWMRIQAEQAFGHHLHECMYMYVCMYVFRHKHTYANGRWRETSDEQAYGPHIHACMHIYVYIYIYTHTYICIHMRRWYSEGKHRKNKPMALTYMCACIYMCIYIYTHTCADGTVKENIGRTSLWSSSGDNHTHERQRNTPERCVRARNLAHVCMYVCMCSTLMSNRSTHPSLTYVRVTWLMYVCMYVCMSRYGMLLWW